jgi:hypothetical protein
MLVDVPADLHHDPDGLDAAAALAAALAADLARLPPVDPDEVLPRAIGDEYEELRTAVTRAAREISDLADELWHAATRSRAAEDAAVTRFDGAVALGPGNRT